VEWYWHFLGLKPGATKAEIKSAYHRLAKLLHRDHGGTDEDMQRLNEAYHLALADNGPAYQEPPKTEPRYEPPPPPPRQEPRKAEQPWSRYGRERPREPFFTPTARNVVRGLINWGVIAALIWGFVAALVSDPKAPQNPPQAARLEAAKPSPPPIPKDDGISYEDAVRLPDKRATPTEAWSLPSGASECTYSTPPYSGPCGRHLAVEKLGALEPKKSADELHLEALVPTAPDSLKANLRHHWREAVVRLWEHPNLKSEFDEVYGVGMGRWVLEKGAILLLARGQSAPALLGSLENALKERIVSEYRGYYSCAQGMTNLTIQLLSPESGSQAAAIFKFGLPNANQSIPFGKFVLGGTVSPHGGRLDLYPLFWLSQPLGYVMVALSGASGDGGNTFEGVVYGVGCTAFSISRVSLSLSGKLPVRAWG
jgi:hypothetical protein